MRRGWPALPVLAVFGIAAGTGLKVRERPQEVEGVRLQPVAKGLVAPLYLTAPPGDPRLFVVEQPGRIRVIRDGRLLPAPFLDLTDKVSYGGERGLLGLAFHPRFATNGRFYVNYTDRHGDGCAIVGGFVYRGRAVPALAGQYVYSDYCSGWLRSFRYEGAAAVDRHAWRIARPGPVLSFGEDAAGELYLLAASGTVYRLAAAGATTR
ncbi:MAG: PQQ-dependent sugar dehydrogenase [Gemmatimonadales bacterium]|jgi:hypothetical protein